MKKILIVNEVVEIVEDDASERNALRDELTLKGFSVLEAKDGEEGLEIALREYPDLILLDIRMPKMNGMAMLHKLRQDTWGKKTPVIILTNYDTNDEILAGIVADHPSYYLIKANTPLEKLLEKIEVVLDSSIGEN